MHTANYYHIKYIRFTIILILCVCITTISSAQDQAEIQIANEYLLKGEKEKAFSTFEALAKKSENINYIHENYLNLMLDLGKFREAESYVERLIKRNDDKVSYRLDLGLIYMRSGDEQKADRYLKGIIKANAADIYRSKSVSDYLASRNLAEYAAMALMETRSTLRNSSLFTLELANIYRMLGKRDEMVDEYLNYVTQTPANIGYVKNLLQILLTKPDELESLERLLYDRAQQNPSSEVFADLLIWVNLQQKNFYGAFIQSRAFDRRFKKEAPKTLEIAQIAMNNQDYENADRSFSYVVKEYAGTENFLPARLGQIKAREAKVKRKFPVSKDSVRILIGEYELFVSQNPDNPSAHEAQLNESALFAYFLDEKDSAVSKLNRLIANPRASVYLKAKAKLELGDIYLLKEEPWESTLLYSQVERMQKDAPIGYEAKLRNAKLSYYKGEFRLAQEHLDILKQATTREIANDAMDLSMRINENTMMDSVGEALQIFASAELDLLQNKLAAAQEKLQNILSTYPSHTLADDVYWLQANLEMKQGNFEKSLGLLQKILDQSGEDILADDAYFLQGDLYENQLKDKAKAMEIYQNFLTKFPGSVFVAEARKRFRTLRGDFVEKPNQ